MGDASVAFGDIDFSATHIEADIAAGFDQAKERLHDSHRKGEVGGQNIFLAYDTRPGVLNAISEKLIAANSTLRGHLIIQHGVLQFKP